jgi:hypothetical protein
MSIPLVVDSVYSEFASRKRNDCEYDASRECCAIPEPYS